MTPLWAFPIYPMLLCAPMAGAIAPSQTREHALEMLFAALAAQGVGFMIAFMMYSAYFHRLMTRKLPRAVARPGMFISVGPSAFTVIGIMELGGVVEERVVGMLALALGVWLWGLACWFFLLSMAANVWTAEKGRLKFSLGWWAFVFPNCGWTLSAAGEGGLLTYGGSGAYVGDVGKWVFVAGTGKVVLTGG